MEYHREERDQSTMTTDDSPADSLAASPSEATDYQHPVLTRGLILLMAVACGMAVANIYYNQPLLAQIAGTFHVSVQSVGRVASLTQIGCACGMLLFIPLGDIYERKGVILRVLCAVTVALLAMAVAPTLPTVIAASLLVGLFSVVPHLLVPFAAQLASPQERGRAVGSVMSGLLIGILLARTVSGEIGGHFGWRSVYFLAAGLMVMLALSLWRMLPRSRPSVHLSYAEMLASLWHLARTEPELRQAAAIGGLLFGGFSVFWTTLVFFLERVYRYPHASQVAGMFGLVGVVGAAAAPLVGRVADRRSPQLTRGVALVITLLSFAVFRLLGTSLWGLIVGVILLDFGVQAAHVSNQTRIYSLIPEARSRLNTVYMVTYFAGGSLGSSLGAYGWSVGHWSGACLVGTVLVVLALATHLFGGVPASATTKAPVLVSTGAAEATTDQTSA